MMLPGSDVVSSRDAVGVLGHCLTIVVKWLEVNTLKLNPEKMEEMLGGKAEVSKDNVLLIFDGIQLSYSGLFKNLEFILDTSLSLEMPVTAAAKMLSYISN